jgi:ribonuclease VapC
MILDSSALLAILLDEESAEDYIDIIDKAIGQRKPLFVPATVLVEGGVVADNRRLGKEWDDLLDRLAPTVVPIDESVARQARLAYRRFGRGAHKAKLNFGDCFSYAVAQHLGYPLLFKGDDFTETDVLCVKRGH